MDKIMEQLVPQAWEGKSIKQILKKEYRVSAAILTGLKQWEDGVLVNGEPSFVTRILRQNDTLKIRIRDGKTGIASSMIPLEILYEDEDIIVLNKPRKMPTHPSQNHHGDTLANALVGYFSGKNFTFRSITRLDKDTSGAVLVAKNPLSGAILVEDMKCGKIQKEYLAVTNGIPNPSKGRLEAPIRRSGESIILRCVAPDGRAAVTEYQTLREGDGLALVQLHPLTGRTHQLRVHMSHLGCPIYGDDMYGAPQREEATRLHCGKLRFRHPLTGKVLLVEAPLPLDMTDLVN